MRQKTFVIDFHTKIMPLVGQEAILCSRRDIVSGHEDWLLYAGDGVPGNVNPSERRYHGWRGTTGRTSVYAYGLRRIVKVSPTKSGELKVTAGRDLHPEWE